MAVALGEGVGDGVGVGVNPGTVETAGEADRSPSPEPQDEARRSTRIGTMRFTGEILPKGRGRAPWPARHHVT